MTNDIRKWRTATFIHMQKRNEAIRELEETKATIALLQKNVEYLTEWMYFACSFTILSAVLLCLTYA